MKSSDLLIDLNDIYGRLIPGILLIIDIFFIVNIFNHIELNQVLKYFYEYPSLSLLLIFIFLGAAFVIGEVSLFFIFRLRRFYHLKTAIEYIEEIDITKEKVIVAFFKSTFSEDVLNSTWPLVKYCKEYLLENSFMVYGQARKIEARINYKGGMIFPLIILAGICFLYHQWIFGLFVLIIVTVFIFGFLGSSRGEPPFIYKAFYQCAKNRKD